MTKFFEKNILVRGRKVQYFTNGRTGKKPLLLLHGFMSDASSLLPLAEEMEVDQPIIIPDLPGFGGSEMLGDDEGLREYVDWFRYFIEAMNIRTPSVIVGYSFGAYIAVLYTSLFAQSSGTKLILLTPVVKIDWRVRIYGRGFRFASIKAHKTAERLYFLQHDMTTRYLRKTRHPHTKSKLMERRRGELAYLNLKLVIKLSSDFLEFDMFPYAERIKVPTIIVTASKDNVAASNATRHFSKLVRKPIIMVDILHAGHLLPIEEPALVATTLKSYLLDAPGFASGPTKPK